MKNAEAKFILSAYRPGGADAGDDTFAAALAQSRADPALATWFAAEQSFDRLMTAKLAQVAPPASLREAILAGAKVSRPVPMVRSWWRQPTWLAVAAGLVVLLGVGVLALRPARALADTRALANFALEDTRHDENHHGAGEPTRALQASLQNPGNKLGRGIPVDFHQLATSGCRTLSFAGHDVLEVCFQRNGIWYHCYIVPRTDFTHTETAPAFGEANGLASVSWSDAEHVFVVVTASGVNALRQIL